MADEQRTFGSTSPFLLALVVVALLGVGVLIGILVNGDEDQSTNETLQASSIGDATRGRELFVSQGCVMCHSYQGQGGTDAPNLDFMKGKLTATDIANMSGIIWDHLPAMKAAFEEEEIPYPTFEGNQMANVIAYLHGGGPPPEVPEGMEMHEEGEEHGEEGGTHQEGEEHKEQGAKSE